MENDQDCFTFIPTTAGASAVIYLCLFLPFNIMQKMGTNADVGDVNDHQNSVLLLCCINVEQLVELQLWSSCGAIGLL